MPYSTSLVSLENILLVKAQDVGKIIDSGHIPVNRPGLDDVFPFPSHESRDRKRGTLREDESPLNLPMTCG